MIVNARARTGRDGVVTRRKRQESSEICTEIAQDALPLEWGGFIIRPTDRKYTSIHDIPNACGIYAWYSWDGDLLYVGRSRSMSSRLRGHHMPDWGGRLLSYRLVPERHLAGVEMAHIKTLGPYHNQALEASSLPFWGAMCSAIDQAWQDVLPAMQERVEARESAIVDQIAARL
jgi:hypothetical protein